MRSAMCLRTRVSAVSDFGFDLEGAEPPPSLSAHHRPASSPTPPPPLLLLLLLLLLLPAPVDRILHLNAARDDVGRKLGMHVGRRWDDRRQVDPAKGAG